MAARHIFFMTIKESDIMKCRFFHVEPHNGVNWIVGVLEEPPAYSSLLSIGIGIAEMALLTAYDLGIPPVSHSEIYLLCKRHVHENYAVKVSDTVTVSVVDAVGFLSNRLPEWMVSICLNALQESK